MGRRIRLILHGNSADDSEVTETVSTLRDEGHTVEVRVTWEAGDAVWMAREAAEEGVETVVAGGGDGTANEIIRGIWESGSTVVSVGILPLGTADDFARAAGIPPDDPEGALRLILEEPARPVDIGFAGGRPFLNMASGGLGARITVETPEEVKETLGKLAYLITGLARFNDIEPVELRAQGDEFQWEGRCYLLAVGNGRMAGGGVELCPGARLDDGLLDLTIIEEIPSDERLEALGRIFTDGFGVIDQYALREQTTRLQITSPEEIYVNLDGEPIQGRRFDFRVAPGRLRAHLPTNCPLLSR